MKPNEFDDVQAHFQHLEAIIEEKDKLIADLEDINAKLETRLHSARSRCDTLTANMETYKKAMIKAEENTQAVQRRLDELKNNTMPLPAYTDKIKALEQKEQALKVIKQWLMEI